MPPKIRKTKSTLSEHRYKFKEDYQRSLMLKDFQGWIKTTPRQLTKVGKGTNDHIEEILEDLRSSGGSGLKVENFQAN